MSSLNTYEKGALFCNGALLVEVLNFSVDIDAQLNPIHTMQKGFAGVSPGSEMTKIEVNSAVPRSGLEFDVLSKLQGVEVVEMVFFAHAKKAKVKGYISNLKQNYGADKSAELSFSFLGGPVEESTL
jgi:hypothetical protein